MCIIYSLSHSPKIPEPLATANYGQDSATSLVASGNTIRRPLNTPGIFIMTYCPTVATIHPPRVLNTTNLHKYSPGLLNTKLAIQHLDTHLTNIATPPGSPTLNMPRATHITDRYLAIVIQLCLTMLPTLPHSKGLTPTFSMSNPSSLDLPTNPMPLGPPSLRAYYVIKLIFHTYTPSTNVAFIFHPLCIAPGISSSNINQTSLYRSTLLSSTVVPFQPITFPLLFWTNIAPTYNISFNPSTPVSGLEMLVLYLISPLRSHSHFPSSTLHLQLTLSRHNFKY